MTVLTLVIICVLIVGGGTALVVGLSRSSADHARRPLAGKGTAGSHIAPCPPSGTQLSAAEPSRAGQWRFELTEKGTFGSVVGGPSGTAYAIEACGRYESDLRVVQLRLGRPTPVQASAFVHAALLTSSLARSGGSLYFGAARLDLAGSESSPPYELTLYRLDPATMTITASRALGRGYSLALETVDGAVVACTGSSLFTIDRTTLVPRLLAGFGGSVAQHVVADSAFSGYAVSLFTPAAVPPAAGAGIEVLTGRMGHVVSAVSLAGGSDPESLAFADGRLWAAIGDGLMTTVHVYRLPALTPMAAGRSGGSWPVEAVPENIALDARGGVVWTMGLSLLECSSAANGRVLAVTYETGPAPVFISQVFGEGGAVYAVTAAGIGRLLAPAVCTP